MLASLRGPDDQVAIVWKVVVKRLTLADELFTRCQSLNVVDKLVLSLVELVGAKGRFVAVMNELVREERLRVPQLDGRLTVPCIDQYPHWLSCCRRFAVRSR
jgi:hypothetical protein